MKSRYRLGNPVRDNQVSIHIDLYWNSSMAPDKLDFITSVGSPKTSEQYTRGSIFDTIMWLVSSPVSHV